MHILPKKFTTDLNYGLIVGKILILPLGKRKHRKKETTDTSEEILARVNAAN